MPDDPKALLDLRYLWDAQGNLLQLQQRAGMSTTANYAYDPSDRLVVSVQGDGKASQASRYFYDREGRRLLAQESIADQRDLKTNTTRIIYGPGTHRWLGSDGRNADYDNNGQPERIGHRAYRWDALGRLLEVKEDDKTLARYTYNHRGERIAKQAQDVTYYLYQDKQLTAELDAQGNIKRQYVYMADQPIAVIDGGIGKELESEERGAWSRLTHDLSTVWHAWFTQDEAITWLHANHLGAVEAATSQDGKLVWRAHYQPSGEARIVTTNFALNLRLPGQYADAETGLFYNGRRYYDPKRGSYLTPDPLGAPDGPNPYAYVRNNPLKYVDPSGLVLFAFDGTGNGNDLNDPAMNGSNYSNVWRFNEAYNDGDRHYVSGVGTVHKDDKYGDIVPDTYAKGTPLALATPFDPLYINDMGGNYSGPARIDRMMLYLRDEAEAYDKSQVMDIDIVGFSRGAAEARDFANRLVANTKMIAGTDMGWLSYTDENGKNGCQKVNLRFMGLFDTVLSTNYSDTSYNLSIPKEFGYVAQAVALNEYRSDSLLEFMKRNPLPHSMHWGGFPLESIGASSSQAGQVRIEMGFLGAHADIGGGYGAGEDQLSLVALNWMVRQAQDAGVNMNTGKVSSLPTGNPILHDQSMNMLYGDPNKWKSTYPATPNPDPEAPNIPYMGPPEDRDVHGAVSGTTERTMGFDDGSMTNADTHQFISYAPRSMEELGWSGPLDARTMGNRTGTVDVDKYLAWLREHGYCFVGDTQGSCAAKSATQ
jgi:RHS repeat-associated protein